MFLNSPYTGIKKIHKTKKRIMWFEEGLTYDKESCSSQARRAVFGKVSNLGMMRG